MSTWDFSAAGVNGLLNNTSKSKMKITMIPYEDIMRNEKNHYSIEDIESLAASISDVGLREPLEVKPLDDGQYMLIGGERRYTAIGQLRAEGNTQYDLVPCIVVDVQGIDLPLSDELKELYVLTTTNAEQREKTDYDLMLQVQNLSRIYTELKAAGYPLRGRQRDMIADKLGISPTQVQRYSSINKNLDEDLKEDFKEGKMPLTVASAAAALPNLTSEKEEITQKDVDQVASVTSSCSPKETKKEVDQAEVTVNADFLQGLKGQVQELQYDLSNGGISVSLDQETRLRNLMDKAVKALNQIQKIVEESK